MRTGPCVWDPGSSWRSRATSLSVVETRDAACRHVTDIVRIVLRLLTLANITQTRLTKLISNFQS